MAGNTIKYLWTYSASNEYMISWNKEMIQRRRERGYLIEEFCITPGELDRKWLPFPELDGRWRVGDKRLLTVYEKLAKALEGVDVLISYCGANIHPEFLKFFDLLKVCSFGDDPESTEISSRYIAPAFDIQLINNISCIDMYKSWGCKHVFFWPLGSISTVDNIPQINEGAILNKNREIPIVYIGERNGYKKKRFAELLKHFPQCYLAGAGWARGTIEWQEMWQVYENSQIGWNIHNTTGPINFRTYELPAFGVLQICDNKLQLGKIFELDKEVIGFDDINECIQKTEYYLNHKKEQREIACNGHKRWLKEYHPDAIWEKLISIVNPLYNQFKHKENNETIEIILMKITEKKKRNKIKKLGFHLLRNVKNISNSILIMFLINIKRPIKFLIKIFWPNPYWK